MKSNFCGKCGTTNTEQMLFCLQCGQNLETVNQSNNQFGQNTSIGQTRPAFSPNQPQPPNYAAQNTNLPPVSDLPLTIQGFQPFQPNSNALNNFSPPNNPGFQLPDFQQTPISQPIEPQKKGIGGKIFSALGALVVGLFLLVKGGFVLMRFGRLGGTGMVIAIALIIAIAGIVILVKRSQR